VYTGIKFEVDITYSFLDTEANVKIFLDRQTEQYIKQELRIAIRSYFFTHH